MSFEACEDTATTVIHSINLNEKYNTHLVSHHWWQIESCVSANLGVVSCRIGSPKTRQKSCRVVSYLTPLVSCRVVSFFQSKKIFWYLASNNGCPQKTCLGSLKTLKYVSGCVLIPGGPKKNFLLNKCQRSNKKQSNTLHKFFFSHGVKI